MYKLFILILGLCMISSKINAQEVPIPESAKTVAHAKCYWSYSVERTDTKRDSSHNYMIRVELVEVDSSDKHYSGKVFVKGALVYCTFLESGMLKKVPFKAVGRRWIGKFTISTNQPLEVKILARYCQQERVMRLTLNEGYFPGEPDR